MTNFKFRTEGTKFQLLNRGEPVSGWVRAVLVVLGLFYFLADLAKLANLKGQTGALCGRVPGRKGAIGHCEKNNLTIPAGPFGRWQRWSLVTDPDGYAPHERLASG
ncbi:MAG: hypothetical protein JWR69_1165 [Pedosphaera sp.]|nr:hypothetical protein [Pedosphaera sp.]